MYTEIFVYCSTILNNRHICTGGTLFDILQYGLLVLLLSFYLFKGNFH